MSKSARLKISSIYPYALVRPLEKVNETVTEGGVYLPPQHSDKVLEGEVVEISEQASSEYEIFEKDILYIKQFSSRPVGGTDLRFVNIEEDVFAKKE